MERFLALTLLRTLVTSCVRLALLVPILETTDITWAVSTPTILISVRFLVLLPLVLRTDPSTSDRSLFDHRVHLFPKSTTIPKARSTKYDWT
jgi:hypothetical protein